MKRPLLILLEGANDLEFLVRIASRLQSDLRCIPDLGHLQAAERIVLVPVGGGDPSSWPNRLRGQVCARFICTTGNSSQRPTCG
jgi:hypothetical protein